MKLCAVEESGTEIGIVYYAWGIKIVFATHDVQHDESQLLAHSDSTLGTIFLTGRLEETDE